MRIYSTGEKSYPFLYTIEGNVGKGFGAASEEDVALIRFGLNVLYPPASLSPNGAMCRALPFFGGVDAALIACISAVQASNCTVTDGYVSPLKNHKKITMMGLLGYHMRKNLFNHWPYLWKAPQMRSGILREKMQYALEGADALPMPLK